MFGEEQQGALGWDGHLLLLYHTETERRMALAAWMRCGLEHNEKIVCAEDDKASGPSVLDLLADQLDVVAATASGYLETVAPRELREPEERRQIVERALADRYDAIRLLPIARSATTSGSEESYPERELAIDDLCAAYPVSALCQCDRATTHDQSLDQVVSDHFGGLREAHLNTGVLDGQLLLAGELDVGNGDLLACTLRAAADKAAETLPLGMSRVTFLSVVAARALVEGTQDFRDRGGQLRLVAPPADVEWFLRTLGVDTMPHVELVEAVP
ncbi:MAG TPA: MEDS domain-containing protein [Actinopolymorphaceae bacterium]|nr:MEDS domain-containing protein [Actinopolymorphaceae bacterium]